MFLLIFVLLCEKITTVKPIIDNNDDASSSNESSSEDDDEDVYHKNDDQVNSDEDEDGDISDTDSEAANLGDSCLDAAEDNNHEVDNSENREDANLSIACDTQDVRNKPHCENDQEVANITTSSNNDHITDIPIVPAAITPGQMNKNQIIKRMQVNLNIP